MHHIIIGVDRSQTALNAARRAADMAAAYDTNLHIVMCVERGKNTNVTVGGVDYHADWVSEAEQYLGEVAQQMPHSSVTTTVGLGDPAKTLCEEAERLEARAIVVGNKRVQGVSRLLGSIAGDVLRHAPCDVLVAHTVEH
jgi:nucleotide-binding universal stress UspA family protein